MDYKAAAAAFLQPVEDPAFRPKPTVDATPARALRDAIEPFAMHWLWSESVNAATAAAGFNFLTTYVGGRAAPLGDLEVRSVSCLFAAFEPGFIQDQYLSARETMPPDQMLELKHSAIQRDLGSLIGFDTKRLAGSLHQAINEADPAGKPMFTSRLTIAETSEGPLRLWALCDAIREHRGDCHVATCVAAGLDAVQANILTELFVGMPLGSYTATRGWSDERVAQAVDVLEQRGLVHDKELTEEGMAFRAALEKTTDETQYPVIDAIGPDLDGALEILTTISDRCIEVGSFPSDPFKRAAG